MIGLDWNLVEPLPPHIRFWVISRRLGRPVVRHHLIDSALEVHIAAEGYRIGKRQDLRRPEAAEAILPINPVEEVSEPGPSDRACRTSGRSILVVDHERIGPGLL